MLMALALMASVSIHAVVLSTQFVQINPRLFEDQNLPMDVVLVNAKTAQANLAADALAQVNLAGGGNTDENRRARTPLPASTKNQVGEAQAMEARVRALEQQAQQLMTRLKSDRAVDSRAPVPPDVAPTPAPSARDLMQQAQQQADLMAQVEKEFEAYQKRPKRKFFGANVREYAFARYVEDWVAKVERIGNLNYPEAARRQGIYGSLQITVSIMADGSLEKVEIDRSSGSKILDAAAQRIVEMGAPYAAFPTDMRDKADILSITRTWTFTRGDQLVGGN
jgi:protein TonB